MGEAAVSNFYLMTRAAYDKLSRPVAKAALRAGFTPDSITILGTAGTVVAALTLFPIGQLWWGAFAVFIFVLADMLDGAMARERGGGTRFGAVLDATCDRIGDGAVFCGLLWWAAFGLKSASLVVATLICLVTSQVISYIKARAEASGLSGEGGLIERPERLIIVLVGAGLSGVPFLHMPWLVHVAMWVLAVASLVTVGQRLHTVRTSPGAMEPLTQHRRRQRREARDGAHRRGRGRAMTSTPAGQKTESRRPFPVRGPAHRFGLRRRLASWSARCRSSWHATLLTPARSTPRAAADPSSCARTWPGSLGVTPAQVPDGLIRASLASYARYWREAFRLPSMDLTRLGRAA